MEIHQILRNLLFGSLGFNFPRLPSTILKTIIIIFFPFSLFYSTFLSFSVSYSLCGGFYLWWALYSVTLMYDFETNKPTNNIYFNSQCASAMRVPLWIQQYFPFNRPARLIYVYISSQLVKELLRYEANRLASLEHDSHIHTHTHFRFDQHV